MFYFRILVLFVCVFAVSGSVLAQTQSGAEKSPQKQLHDRLTERVSNVMKTLDQKEAFHFMTVYANYTLVSTVKAVREDVSDAVTKCAENNKSMKGDLDNRFAKWEQGVGSRLEDAEANINNMTIAQNYISQADLQSIFAQVDKMRAINSSNFEKTPVTSPEACEFMMSKMDETEDSMKQLLQVTLQSYPNILEQTQE